VKNNGKKSHDSKYNPVSVNQRVKIVKRIEPHYLLEKNFKRRKRK
jgi:hypothetical protein